MDIDYTVAALMFPAIPLMMTMYSNRFHTLSALIRQIHDQYTFEKKIPPVFLSCCEDEKLKTLLLFGFTIGHFPVNLSKFLNAAVHVHQ